MADERKITCIRIFGQVHTIARRMPLGNEEWFWPSELPRPPGCRRVQGSKVKIIKRNKNSAIIYIELDDGRSIELMPGMAVCFDPDWENMQLNDEELDFMAHVKFTKELGKQTIPSEQLEREASLTRRAVQFNQAGRIAELAAEKLAAHEAKQKQRVQEGMPMGAPPPAPMQQRDGQVWPPVPEGPYLGPPPGGPNGIPPWALTEAETEGAGMAKES